MKQNACRPRWTLLSPAFLLLGYIHGGLVIITEWESVAEPLGETSPCEHYAECSIVAPPCLALLGLQRLHHEAKMVRGDA